jgi:hypothetical protein
MAKLNYDDLTVDELRALSRSAESRANVFRSLAGRDEKYRGRLDEVNADFRDLSQRLRDQGVDPSNTDPTSTVVDKEGTAPTLADGQGNFADHAETANLGGIGINDSNTDPEGVRQELSDRADPDSIEERQRRVAEAQAVIDAGGATPRTDTAATGRPSVKRERLSATDRAKASAKVAGARTTEPTSAPTSGEGSGAPAA